MLWSQEVQYEQEPFETEEELESAICLSSSSLFGKNRIYFNIKKLIGQKGSIKNIPDGYLLDLSSNKEPKIYVVEVELASHEPLKHIAVQILEFSLSFETSPQQVKAILKNCINKDVNAIRFCNDYAIKNGFENIDYLLERMIYKKDSFNALVIIDELDELLETVLLSRFKFPVEILTFERFKTLKNVRLYKFEPFLNNVISIDSDYKQTELDPSDIDTIVVPAQDEGFNEVFIGQNSWYAIRIHSSMIPKIKYIASYRVAPASAITHIAKVHSISLWQDSNKYLVKFESPAKEINHIKLVPRSRVKALQNTRYTSYDKLMSAKNLDEAFY